MWTRALRQKAFYGEVTGMQMRKLAVAVIFLALAGSTYAAARDRSHGRSRGHVRHSVAKPAKTPHVSSSEITPAGSDRRDPEDLALDRKIKSICRGC
jgi:hypothetical protein